MTLLVLHSKVSDCIYCCVFCLPLFFYFLHHCVFGCVSRYRGQMAGQPQTSHSPEEVLNNTTNDTLSQCVAC